MSEDFLHLAPNLKVYVVWSARVSDTLYGSTLNEPFQPTDVNQPSRPFHALFGRTEAAASQIQRFYALTNSLPVVGDRLWQTNLKGGEVLRIEKRTLHSAIDSDSLLLIYEVSSEETHSFPTT